MRDWKDKLPDRRYKWRTERTNCLTGGTSEGLKGQTAWQGGQVRDWKDKLPDRGDKWGTERTNYLTGGTSKVPEGQTAWQGGTSEVPEGQTTWMEVQVRDWKDKLPDRGDKWGAERTNCLTGGTSEGLEGQVRDKRCKWGTRRTNCKTVGTRGPNWTGETNLPTIQTRLTHAGGTRGIEGTRRYCKGSDGKCDDLYTQQSLIGEKRWSVLY